MRSQSGVQYEMDSLPAGRSEAKLERPYSCLDVRSVLANQEASRHPTKDRGDGNGPQFRRARFREADETSGSQLGDDGGRAVAVLNTSDDEHGSSLAVLAVHQELMQDVSRDSVRTSRLPPRRRQGRDEAETVSDDARGGCRSSREGERMALEDGCRGCLHPGSEGRDAGIRDRGR